MENFDNFNFTIFAFVAYPRSSSDRTFPFLPQPHNIQKKHPNYDFCSELDRTFSESKLASNILRTPPTPRRRTPPTPDSTDSAAPDSTDSAAPDPVLTTGDTPTDSDSTAR